MSTGKDVLIEFLLELLKEERDQRRRETEENASLIKDLMSKFDKLETDLILDRHTHHMHRRMGRILCDGEDEVDGWVIPTSMKCLVSENSDESLEFPGI